MGKRATPGSATKETKAKKVKSPVDTKKIPVPAEGASSAASSDNMCGPTIRKVHEALDTIGGHQIFVGIQNMSPLSIAEGGTQAPFQQSELKNAIDRNYSCGVNFFWQSFTWLANHRIPINPGQIQEMQRYAFKPREPPTNITFTTVLAIDSNEHDVNKSKGALQRLSPPEPTFALLFTIADAIKDGAGDDILMKWRSLALSIPGQFEVHAAGDPRYWRAHNLRQEATNLATVVKLSVRQWVYDVVGFKKSKEEDTDKTMSSKEVAKEYQKHMHYASTSEKVSDSFVDTAITIHKRVLTNTEAQACLQWCEENLLGCANPWNKSIYSLQSVVDRAQSSERINWAIRGMTDHYRMDGRASY